MIYKLKMARRELLLLFTIGMLSLCCNVDSLGVNWGEFQSHKLPASIVAQMLKDNNITKVKLFEVHEDTMKGLVGTGIEVMIAVPNGELQRMTDTRAAKSWVDKNVTRYLNKGLGTQGVNIKYVAVGNEPFLTSYNGSYQNSTFPALKNIQNALNDAGIGDKIKATIPLNADIYLSPSDHYVPSEGYFRPDIQTQMEEIANFLHKNKAPFMINIYPYINLYQNPGFPKEYAFFDGNISPLVDGNLKYYNSFDAAYDTLVAALEKVGIKDMPIFIGEIGWPTDGDKNANLELAHRFYSGLLKKIGNNQGTPVRQKQYIEVYLFGLLDEDTKSIDPGNFERHWGIFTSDGQPKFPMDITGKGANKTLVGAKNVKLLPKKWCVLSDKANNETAITAAIKYSCDYADCTPLGMGCSCGGLDAKGNASYAFNAYFQTMGQKKGTCDFGSLAEETTSDPSTKNCTFPIKIAPPASLSPASSPGKTPSDDTAADSSPKPSSSYYYGPSLLLIALQAVASVFFIAL